MPWALDAFTNHTYVVPEASGEDGVNEHVPLPEPQPAKAADIDVLTATPCVFCTSR